MTEENNNNEKRSELFSAIAKALFETKDIAPDSTNPFHKNKYASLSAHLNYIKPVFAKNGLAIVQFPTSSTEAYSWGCKDDKHIGAIGIKTIIIHKNGESIEQSCVLPIDVGTSGQQAGALLTYLRRYALASVAGIATDDDDAEYDRVVKSSTTTKYIPTAKPQASAPAQAPAEPISAGDIDPSLVIPFGNNKGKSIGELGLNDLSYWATKWEPRPWEKTGKVSPKDAKLKATALALFENMQNNSASAEETSDEVPF
jgi:hypothetical protein